MSFFFSSRRRHTRCSRDWSSDVCSSDLIVCDLPNPCTLGISRVNGATRIMLWQTLFPGVKLCQQTAPFLHDSENQPGSGKGWTSGITFNPGAVITSSPIAVNLSPVSTGNNQPSQQIALNSTDS